VLPAQLKGLGAFAAMPYDLEEPQQPPSTEGVHQLRKDLRRRCTAAPLSAWISGHSFRHGVAVDAFKPIYLYRLVHVLYMSLSFMLLSLTCRASVRCSGSDQTADWTAMNALRFSSGVYSPKIQRHPRAFPDLVLSPYRPTS
jgi:hypothetical protein